MRKHLGIVGFSGNSRKFLSRIDSGGDLSIKLVRKTLQSIHSKKEDSPFGLCRLFW
jgi:hypothetical protein